MIDNFDAGDKDANDDCVDEPNIPVKGGKILKMMFSVNSYQQIY